MVPAGGRVKADGCRSEAGLQFARKFPDAQKTKGKPAMSRTAASMLHEALENVGVKCQFGIIVPAAGVTHAASGIGDERMPVLVDVVVDYSKLTHFTQGIVKTKSG